MLNFVLCDDNQNILNKFSKMLDVIFVNNELDAKVSLATQNPEDVLKYVKNDSVDVLILDIDLKSDLSGIDIANKVRAINKKVYIIFATAHLEYLILAYKYKTFDYLPKPISIENLEATVLRLFNDINFSNMKKNFLAINNKNTMIKVDSILYIEKEATKLIIKTENAQYGIYSSFNKIKDTLPSNFIRCHKSYIVNINNIESIENNIIFFDKNHKISCTIGQVYKKNFLEVFNNEFITNINKWK